MSVLGLSRWQFGITTVYHFFFVPLTIGLSILVAGMQTTWFISRNPAYLRMTKFFGKLFLINFAVGVVTGMVQEFQFGMSGKVDTDRWRRNWDRAIFLGSAVPALLWGVAFANIVGGVPLNAAHVYTGNLLTLLSPHGLLGGLVTLTLFTLHGAIFLSLKTAGEIRHRARAAALRLAPAVVLLAAGFPVVSQAAHGKPGSDVTAAVAAVALLCAVAAAAGSREGWAFAFTAVAIVAAVATLFGDLWPNVLPSSTAAADSPTVSNASSAHYTLLVMTWVALIFTPVVLGYRGWTYWIFRKRLSTSDIGPVEAIPPARPPARFAPDQP